MAQKVLKFTQVIVLRIVLLLYLTVYISQFSENNRDVEGPEGEEEAAHRHQEGLQGGGGQPAVVTTPGGGGREGGGGRWKEGEADQDRSRCARWEERRRSQSRVPGLQQCHAWGQGVGKLQESRALG